MNMFVDDLASIMADNFCLKLKGESIFVTGGTGLFGSWLIGKILEVNRRLSLGINLTILSRDPDATTKSGIERMEAGEGKYLVGDVESFEFIEEKFDRIIHLAATSASETYEGKNQLSKFRMLSYGTERVLQFAVHCEAKHVLFTSSGIVYGDICENIIGVSEEYQGAPSTQDVNSALAQGKRSAEFLCAYYADQYDIQVSIARCFSFVGPGLPLGIHYAIGNFIQDAIGAAKITVRGDGSPVRSFLYMGDLVVWLLALLTRESGPSVYNVGSDQAITIVDLAGMIREILCPNKEIEILGDSEHAVGNFSRNRYVPSIELARRELGVDVWTSLESSIKMTADHAREKY